VAPELIQDGFRPERLADTLAPWIDSDAEHAAARASLARVRERLGEPGASRRAAEWLWTLGE